MTALIGCVKCERRGGIVEGWGQKKEAESRMNRAWKFDLSVRQNYRNRECPLLRVLSLPLHRPPCQGQTETCRRWMGRKQKGASNDDYWTKFLLPLVLFLHRAPHPETPVGLTWKYLRSQMVADFTFSLLGALLWGQKIHAFQLLLFCVHFFLFCLFLRFHHLQTYSRRSLGFIIPVSR